MLKFVTTFVPRQICQIPNRGWGDAPPQTSATRGCPHLSPLPPSLPLSLPLLPSLPPCTFIIRCRKGACGWLSGLTMIPCRAASLCRAACAQGWTATTRVRGTPRRTSGAATRTPPRRWRSTRRWTSRSSTSVSRSTRCSTGRRRSLTRAARTGCCCTTWMCCTGARSSLTPATCRSRSWRSRQRRMWTSRWQCRGCRPRC
mmetsp:Transcript_10968/g.28189  ORF Transcript_10968/g.28189 Transcript_10968/m.28189 type:complete len:201 (-) Transcript_10968:1552-2154(-)